VARRATETDGGWRFEIGLSHVTVFNPDGASVAIPKSDFGQALVGLGIVHIATVQWKEAGDGEGGS